MATVASISKPRMACYFRRKGTTLLLSLNFNKLVADIALFHTQFPKNPFAPDSVAEMGPTQVRKLVFEKHKLGFDNLDHALSLFRRMLQIRTCLSVIDFTQLFSALAKMKEYSTVISLFGETRELGIPINEYTVNILINCFCRENRVDCGFAMLGIFFKCGYKPTVSSFTTLINGYILQDKTADAVNFFLRLTKDGDIMPNEVTYGSIINGICKLGNTKMALSLLSEMREWDVMPNVITYNALMDGYCLQGHMDKAQEVFKSMVDRGLEPDIWSYNILVNGYCKRRNIDEAMCLFREMARKGLKPDTATFNTLLHGLFKLGRCDAADSFFHEMISRGSNPNVLTYSVMLDGFLKNKDIVKAIEVFHSMQDQGIAPNIVVYNILINGMCKAGKIGEARKLFSSVSTKGLKPDVKTYNTIIGGLCEEALLDEAEELLLQMEGDGCPPNGVTYNIVVQAFLKRGDKHKVTVLLQEMNNKNFHQMHLLRPC